MEGEISSAPSAWRGGQWSRASIAAGDFPARLGRGIARAGKEMAEHPVETVAILAVAVAMARLASRRELPIELTARPSRKQRRIAPIAVMASICALMLAGCGLMPKPVVDVRPDPLTFGRVYSDHLVVAGEKIAQERCVSCHPRRRSKGYAGPPPLDQLLSHTTPDRLTDDLIAGLPVGHKRMPRFDFNVTAADALIAYLETLSSPRTRPDLIPVTSGKGKLT